MTKSTQKRLKNKDQEKNPDEIHLLFLYNDDIHSFDYVMESLMEICDHTNVQAEQCTTIAHYKGVCDVKKGELTSLKEMQMGLIQKGLKADIK